MIVLGALALGLPIGGLMGALGGGGGTLTVPALVYLLGQTPQQATAASLVIVGVAALAAAAGHARAGTVRWEVAVPFGAVGIAGAVLGTLLGRGMGAGPLMLGCAGLMIIAAVAMHMRAGDSELDDPEAARLAEPGRGLRALVAVDQRLLVKALPAGFTVGVVTGLFGVSGGFLVVPVLALGLGMPMGAAVGTSLVIVSINSTAGLLARAGDSHIDLALVVPFTVAAVVATVAGRRIALRLPGPTLARAFAWLLAGIALLVAAQSVLA